MAKRTVCLYKGNPIGIESIYTVVNGQQINIPEKIDALREKSRNLELFCSCGCGSNLILVAGDKNLREQHFRLKEGENNLRCVAVAETEISIDSKIVLKCWLEDTLENTEILTRVPIYAIDNTERKYEFSFLSEDKKIAVNYYHERKDISDDKLEILENNSKDVKILYIADIHNSGINGQYPEYMMKIQKRQGYCLFLHVADADYYKAEVLVKYCVQNIDGLWNELLVIRDLLSNFAIDESGNLFYSKKSVLDYVNQKIQEYSDLQQQISAKREEERRKREQELERIRQKNGQQRIAGEIQAKQREQELQENLQLKLAEEEQEEREIYERVLLQIDQQETEVRDSKNRRWFRCEWCNKVAPDEEFIRYGGFDKKNIGTCRACREKSHVQLRKEPVDNKLRKNLNYNYCPECGGKLVEKKGRFGDFIGCQNYPECRYTRAMKKGKNPR